jgi:nucleoside-diphosphate-sugar epimerase
MKRLLVFGLSGQIGIALHPLLEARGYDVAAVSREARGDSAAIHWVQGSLQHVPDLPGGFDALLSLGPLDAFAEWVASARPPITRIVAIGSTSVHSKADARDPAERELAARLRQAETRLRDASAAAGIGLTVLRPTLIYGNGRDRSLSPLLALAQRWRWLPWPRAATGLRQPVHVDDLAAAVLACLDRPETAGRSFDLPGGEALSVAAMLERSVKAQVPNARCVPVPLWMFGLALALAARFSARPMFARGVAARLRSDQVFDAEPARAAFGYAPRRFSP